MIALLVRLQWHAHFLTCINAVAATNSNWNSATSFQDLGIQTHEHVRAISQHPKSQCHRRASPVYRLTYQTILWQGSIDKHHFGDPNRKTIRQWSDVLYRWSIEGHCKASSGTHPSDTTASEVCTSRNLNIRLPAVAYQSWSGLCRTVSRDIATGASGPDETATNCAFPWENAKLKRSWRALEGASTSLNCRGFGVAIPWNTLSCGFADVLKARKVFRSLSDIPMREREV